MFLGYQSFIDETAFCFVAFGGKLGGKAHKIRHFLHFKKRAGTKIGVVPICPDSSLHRNTHSSESTQIIPIANTVIIVHTSAISF